MLQIETPGVGLLSIWHFKHQISLHYFSTINNKELLLLLLVGEFTRQVSKNYVKQQVKRQSDPPRLIQQSQSDL